MSADGLPLVFCASGAEALGQVVGLGDRGLAVLVHGDGRVSLAFMSPFGPCVRGYGAEDRAAGVEDFVLEVVDQSFRRGVQRIALACGDASLAAAIADSQGREADQVPVARDVEQALAGFRGTLPEVPTFHDALGRERARTWALAPLPPVPFRRGDVLKASVEAQGARHVVRWRSSGQMDGGIHVVLDRGLSPEEVVLVGAADAVVLDAVFCVMPDEADGCVSQTLVLDVPATFARAFRDGRLPRHGGLSPASNLEMSL